MKKQNKTENDNPQIDSTASENAVAEAESANESAAAKIGENAKKFIAEYLNDKKGGASLPNSDQSNLKIIVITTEQKEKLDSIADSICDAIIKDGLCVDVLREAWKIGLSKAKERAKQLEEQNTAKQETGAL